MKLFSQTSISCNCNPTNKYNRKVSPCAGNIDETVRRIHHTLEWRRNFNVDSFSKFDETSTLGKVMHPTFLGLASPLGSPVAYLPLGQIDFKGKHIHDPLTTLLIEISTRSKDTRA